MILTTWIIVYGHRHYSVKIYIYIIYRCLEQAGTGCVTSCVYGAILREFSNYKASAFSWLKDKRLIGTLVIRLCGWMFAFIHQYSPGIPNNLEYIYKFFSSAILLPLWCFNVSHFFFFFVNLVFSFFTYIWEKIICKVSRLLYRCLFHAQSFAQSSKTEKWKKKK